MFERKDNFLRVFVTKTRIQNFHLIFVFGNLRQNLEKSCTNPRTNLSYSRTNCPIPKQICPIPEQNCPIPEQNCPNPEQNCPIPEQNCPIPEQNCPIPPNSEIGGWGLQGQSLYVRDPLI